MTTSAAPEPDPAAELEAALGDPPDDLLERARLLDDAAAQLRSSLSALDGV